MHDRIVMPLLAAVLAVATVSGCSQSEQDRYDSAVQSVKDARSNLQEAQEHVQQSSQQVQRMQQQYEQAVRELNNQQQTLKQAQEHLTETATDEVLLHAVQRDVLSRSQFSNAHITTAVDQRVVTLTGTVPNEKTRREAVEMINEKAGVAHVVDRLSVARNEG